jgi:DNA-binding transcriptional LysR family regulator
MELTSLRYFVTVARELHFRRAAAKLNMTQSPLSTAVKKLEDELNTPLFERTSRSVKLTAAGEFFLPEAEAVLRRADLAKERIQKMLSGNDCKLSIGYNEPALNTFLPAVLARCRKNLPELQLELCELETAEQLKFLAEGRLDIGFMRPAGFELDAFESKLLHRENYRLVMQFSNKLAALPKITVNDLSRQSLILFARDVNPAAFDSLTAALTPADMPPPIFRQDARNKHSMLAMVKAGFGAALMPESCCKEAVELLAVRELAVSLPSVDIMAVWQKEKNSGSTLKKFISLLPEFD